MALSYCAFLLRLGARAIPRTYRGTIRRFLRQGGRDRPANQERGGDCLAQKSARLPRLVAALRVAKIGWALERSEVRGQRSGTELGARNWDGPRQCRPSAQPFCYMHERGRRNHAPPAMSGAAGRREMANGRRRSRFCPICLARATWSASAAPQRMYTYVHITLTDWVAKCEPFLGQAGRDEQSKGGLAL